MATSKKAGDKKVGKITWDYRNETLEVRELETLPHTQTTLFAYHRWEKLHVNLPVILVQKWWEKRIPIGEKISYLKAVSDADANLWERIYEAYPQIKGTGCTVHGNGIRTGIISSVN